MAVEAEVDTVEQGTQAMLAGAGEVVARGAPAGSAPMRVLVGRASIRPRRPSSRMTCRRRGCIGFS
jgi:hypothetical protein